MQCRFVGRVGRDRREELSDRNGQALTRPVRKACESVSRLFVAACAYAIEQGIDSLREPIVASEAITDGDDRLLCLGPLGGERFQPALPPQTGSLPLQPLDEDVAIAGIAGRAPDPLELLPNPLTAAARHRVLVEIQRGHRPAAPDAQLVHVLGVLIFLPGRQHQVVQDRVEPVA